jgi:NADPH-dependent 2,4-dienoyl-CoA reductase/sulfur reductase-like enzyme/nitrite reductase/ring-hydroxylating ferredoxin subunit
MDEEKWMKAGEEKDLKEGVPFPVTVDEKKVMLLLLNGKIHACGNECSHYGAPLTDGVLKGSEITCPWHNARFDVTSGRMTSAPALNDLPHYEAKIEGGAVYIRPGGPHRIEMPEGEDDRTFVIVGAGASGNAAAETLRREGFSGKILMITAEKDLPYDRTMLTKDFLSGEAPAKWLPLRSEKFYGRLKIDILTDHRVVSLDPVKKKITFHNGGSIVGDSILIATGGVPRALNVKGSELEGIHYLRSRADCTNIISELEHVDQVAVLGASFIGLEVAASLRQRGLPVHVVAPENVPLARVFGEEIGRKIEQIHREKGVQFHLERTASEMRGDGRIREIVLDDGTRIKAGLLVIGVGIIPAVDFLAGSGLVEDGAVTVDDRLQTNKEEVFASGDIAAVPDRLSGGTRRVEHWVEAERQGQHAARAMLGSSAPYSEIPFFWTRQFGISVRYLGYARKPDKIVFRGNKDSDQFIAGYYENGVLCAVSSIGMAKEFIMIGEKIKAGENIDPEQLSDTDFDLLT